MTRDDLVPVGPGPARGGAESSPRPAVPAAERAPEAAPEQTPALQVSATVADIEALLFVAERPLSRTEIRSLCGLGAEEVDEHLGDLEVQLRDRGIRLVSSGDHVQLVTAPESGALIARYIGAAGLRLSPAALETLAIVAYRQPVTRGVVERIRGVDSDHVVRGLLHRRLIVEQGRAETPGRPILYGTSFEFMERFGLTSLDDLPPIEAEIAARLAEAEAPDEDVADGDDPVPSERESPGDG